MNDPANPPAPQPPVPPVAPVAPTAPVAPGAPITPVAPTPVQHGVDPRFAHLPPPPSQTGAVSPPLLAPPPVLAADPAPTVYDERYVRSAEPTGATSHRAVVVRSVIAAVAGAILVVAGLQFIDEAAGLASSFDQVPLYLAGYGGLLFVLCALPAAALKRLSPVSVLVAGAVGAVVFAVAFYAVLTAAAGAFRLGLGAAVSGESDVSIGFWFGSPAMLMITALFVPMAVAIALDGERQVPAVTVVLRFTLAGIATMVLLFACIERDVKPWRISDVEAAFAEGWLLFLAGLVCLFGLALLFSLLPSREATRYAEARGSRIGAGYLVSASATKVVTSIIVFAFVVYNGIALVNGIELYSAVQDLFD